MSIVNPLAHLSDDELVATQAQHPIDNHYLNEMLRRHKQESSKLGAKIRALNRWLLFFTVAIFVLTGVLVWTTLREVRDVRGQSTDAAPAISAGPAWVLWWNYRIPRDTWVIAQAHPTVKECTKDLTERISSLTKDGWSSTVDNDFGTVTFQRAVKKDQLQLRALHCLPDTVDPRGPKGK